MESGQVHASCTLRLLLLAGAAILTAGNVWLWARYGVAVFLEMVRTGLAACAG
jgi:hypothetical protein